MSKKKKKFIVPHDFTSRADCALDHAIRTAEITGAEILLLHVVAKNSDIDDAHKKLNKIVDRELKTDGHQIHLTAHVRIGNIFDDIGDFASENNAELIFMGTHGASGWQHITGSHAMKVIGHSLVPFIVVQEKEVKPTGYDDIVVPLDLNKETKQKLTMVANMAKYFDSRIHIVIPDESDEYFKRDIKANIQFAKKYFAERDLEMSTTLVPSSGFDKEVVRHAVKIDADLIAIVNLQKNTILGLLGHNYEQKMITNEGEIPVMIVNPITKYDSDTGIPGFPF